MLEKVWKSLNSVWLLVLVTMLVLSFVAPAYVLIVAFGAVAIKYGKHVYDVVREEE